MNEVTERIRALRATVKLEDVFNGKPEAAELKSGCAAVELGFSKM